MSGLGPAVVDGELRYTSPSAISKFDPDQDGGCNRKWWYRYVEGRPEPQSKAAAFGETQVHKPVEEYLTTGVDHLNPVVRPGIAMLKGYRALHALHPSRVLVESTLGNLTADGVRVVGRRDLVNLSGAHVDAEGNPHPSPPEVLDHKSTSDIKWAKPNGSLIATVQMATYGEATLREQPAWDQVRLSHAYYVTKRRGFLKTTEVRDRDEVAARWATIESTVREMRGVAKATEVTQVKANLGSCSSYGGCPYRDVCPRAPDQVLVDLFGFLDTGKDKGDMGLIDELMAGGSTTAPTVVVTSPSTAVVGHVTPAPGVAGDPVAELAEARKRLAALEARVTAESVPVTVKMLTEQPAQAVLDRQDPGAKLPMGAGLMTIVPKDAPASGSREPTAKPVDQADMASLPPAVQEHVAQVQTETPAAEAPKRGRGRPKKNTLNAKALAETGEAVSYFDLFVDCSVDGADDARPIDEYLSGVVAEIQEKAGLADLRLASGDHPLAFGRWRGVLAAAVRADAGTLSGTYTMTGVRDSEFKAVALEALWSLARLRVRGR